LKNFVDIKAEFVENESKPFRDLDVKPFLSGGEVRFFEAALRLLKYCEHLLPPQHSMM
jgi:hypothetical protein